MAFNIKAWASKKGKKLPPPEPEEVEDDAHEPPDEDTDAEETETEDAEPDETGGKMETPKKKGAPKMNIAAFVKRKRGMVG